MSFKDTRDLIATLCMGEFWCPEHSEYDQEDLDQGYVTEITQFDLDCGTDLGEMAEQGSCHVCQQGLA